MLDVPEYDLRNTDSLTVLTESEVISSSEAERFREQLIEIAGRSPNGKPRLRMVWGPTHRDEMSTDPEQIKYLDFTHRGIQLGERRFFVEIHRTPEFLERSGRYKVTNDPDDIQDFYFCKACDAELTLTNGDLPPCHKCGSTRNYLRQIRTAGEGRLLQPMPADGCYDYWLRLERANLTYHPPDGEALQVIRALWEWEKMPQNQRDALEQADREVERRREIQLMRQQTTTHLHFGGSLILPPQYR